MRDLIRACAVVAAGVTALAACGRGGPPAVADRPAKTAARTGGESLLTAADVQAFVAVRARALQRLEAALADVESKGGDVLAHVQELSVAERDAARALGVDWRRFTWVRDQIGRLLTSQRQQEDQRLLQAELTRSKDDLEAQLKAAGDVATRQFLEAQLKALSGQLERLERDRQVPAPQAQEMRVLESARAEIATLQGRQDKIQHRLQELLQRTAAGTDAVPTARPPAP